MSTSSINPKFKYLPADLYHPSGKEKDLNGWEAIIQENETIGKVDGYLVDENDHVCYFSIALAEAYWEGEDGKHILFPAEETQQNEKKQTVFLNELSDGFLSVYPVYSPGAALTMDLEKKIRAFFTSGISNEVHLRDVIKHGPRTTMRHGPLGGERQI